VIDRLQPLRVLLDPLASLARRKRKHVGKMQRTAVGGLRDLLAAAEAVCHDDRVFRGGAHRWQQATFADRLRDRVMTPLEPE
jgi:hypothetical protein